MLLREDVEFVEELAPVIERIVGVLPRDVVWNLYSSDPYNTHKTIQFPYCRVDAEVILARDISKLLDSESEKLSQAGRKLYDMACVSAFKALVWVEIGFEGIENLAKSPASRNWTSGVGHFASDQEREREIMKTDKPMYKDYLSGFMTLRSKFGITDDYFNQYGVEYLLDSV